MLPASVFSAMPGINIRVEGTAEDIKPMKVVLGPCSLALALEQPESREDVEAIQKAAAAAAADGGDYFSPLRGSHAAHVVYMPEMLSMALAPKDHSMRQHTNGEQ